MQYRYSTSSSSSHFRSSSSSSRVMTPAQYNTINKNTSLSLENILRYNTAVSGGVRGCTSSSTSNNRHGGHASTQQQYPQSLSSSQHLQYQPYQPQQQRQWKASKALVPSSTNTHGILAGTESRGGEGWPLFRPPAPKTPFIGGNSPSQPSQQSSSQPQCAYLQQKVGKEGSTKSGERSIDEIVATKAQQ